MKHVLGIDVGGTGIKGAIVDIEGGQLLSDRIRIPTPVNSSPDNVLEIFLYIQEYFQYKGVVGIGFPGPVHRGVIKTANNLNSSNKRTINHERFRFLPIIKKSFKKSKT